MSYHSPLPQELISHESGRRHKIAIHVASTTLTEKGNGAIEQTDTSEKLEPPPPLPEVKYIIKIVIKDSFLQGN